MAFLPMAGAHGAVAAWVARGVRGSDLLHFGVRMWYCGVIHLGRMALLGWRARWFVPFFTLFYG